VVEVKGIAYHSGAVQEGFLFAAIRGLKEDGTKYIPTLSPGEPAPCWSNSRWKSREPSRSLCPMPGKPWPGWLPPSTETRPPP